MAWVGLAALCVDQAVFHALRSAGAGIGEAHAAGYIIAIVATCFARLRALLGWGPAARLGWEGMARLVGVSIFGLFLRGGLLALLTQRLGWPVCLALAAAFGVGAVVSWLGCKFYVAPQGERAGTWRWRADAGALLVCSVLLRLVYLGLPDLLPQEAYHWNYAQHPDLSYLDHPPMVAWLIASGTAIFGDTEFGVRFGTLVFSLVTAGFIFGLARRLFDATTALCAAMLAGTLPFFFGTGFATTPDAAVVTWWAGSLFFLERALLAERRLAWWGVGACMGLGMLSKYTIGLLGVATLAFVLLDPPSRRWLRRPEPYAAALLAVLLFSPVLLWNARHEWASFAFQSTRRLAKSFEFSPHVLLSATLLLVTPLGFLGALRAFAWRESWWDEGRDRDGAWRRRLFLGVMGLAPLAVFVLYSFRQAPKANWSGPAWLALLPVLARQMLVAPGDAPSRLWALVARLWQPTLACLVLLYAAAFHYLVIGLPGPPPHSKALAGVDWCELGRSVEELEEELEARLGEEPLVVGTDRYFIASALAFYRPNRTEAVHHTASQHLIGGEGLMYEFWFPTEHQVGRTCILVGLEVDELSDKTVARYFQRLEPIREKHLTRDGHPAGKYYYRIAYGYRIPARRTDLAPFLARLTLSPAALE